MRPPLPEAFWREVRAAYAGPGRAYHGPAHLDDVLARYDVLQWDHPLEALIALAWHDAVLVPARTTTRPAAPSRSRE
jgi:predicted metal-dependent HD superfamily phosphohydrolase